MKQQIYFICFFPFFAACQKSKVQFPADIQEAVDNNSSSIISGNVRHAIMNLQDQVVANGLWSIRFFSEYVQGTSPLESLNSVLAGCKPLKTTSLSLELLTVILSLTFLQYNLKYVLFDPILSPWIFVHYYYPLFSLLSL
jgi:hypothetical protein